MKLSNKILFGFFGFIFLYMTAAFAEIRLRGTFNDINDTNSVAETAALPEVTQLIVNNLDWQVNVAGSDQPRIEVRSASGDLLKNLTYSISGDTLTLLKLEREKNVMLKVTVYMPAGSFMGITVNGADVNIEALAQRDLSVVQNGGRVAMTKNNQIDVLHLEASDTASFGLSDGRVNTLSVQIDNSQAHIHTSVRRLRGSLQNNSYLLMTEVEEIQFRKDDSSRLHFYNRTP